MPALDNDLYKNAGFHILMLTLVPLTYIKCDKMATLRKFKPQRHVGCVFCSILCTMKMLDLFWRLFTVQCSMFIVYSKAKFVDMELNAPATIYEGNVYQ